MYVKANKNHVVHYHCKSPYKARFNANKVNKDFIEELKLFRIAKNEQSNFVKNIVLIYFSSDPLKIDRLNKKAALFRTALKLGVEYGARTHDLLNHNQAL